MILFKKFNFFIFYETKIFTPLKISFKNANLMLFLVFFNTFKAIHGTFFNDQLIYQSLLKIIIF